VIAFLRSALYASVMRTLIIIIIIVVLIVLVLGFLRRR